MTTARVLPLLLAFGASAAFAQAPTSPPPAAPVRPAALPPFQEAVLPNGLRLLVVESHEQPVVSMSLSFPAGGRYDPAGREGLADMVAGLLTKGAGGKTADEVSAAIEGVGGSIGASAGADFLTIRADALTPNLGLAFGLMADAVTRPAFAPAELSLLRTQTLSGLRLELAQPSSLASRYFARELYGANPYARRPVPKSIEAITRDDLVRFQRLRLRPGGALLVVAGDVTLATARRLAMKALAGWTGAAPVAARAAAPPARAATDILLVHRPGSVQSNIVVGNTTFGPTDPRFYALTLANRVLGGGAASRLFMILREQKSWTYGAYSDFTRPAGIGAFHANTEVRTEVTDSALREMLTQLRRIGSDPVPADELTAARDALVGSFPLSLQTADDVAGAVAQARLLGLPANYLATYRTRLAAVPAAAVSAAAHSAIRPDRAVIVVVGDATKLYDRLKAIAPVRLVDVDGNPLPPAQLTARAAALPLDLARLVPRNDSFTVMVQGRPFGYQRAVLERTADGLRYTEETAIPAAGVQQTTTLTLGTDGSMREVHQTGKAQGQDTKIDVTYAAGRAKGSATTPAQGGPKTVAVDTTVAPGTLDDNAIQALLPALPWTAGARWTAPVFASGLGTSLTMTLAVAGEESVTVPAGTFQVFRAELTGGPQPVTFYVTKAAPFRLVKVAIAGTPIEMQLAK
jgi:zinc protease